MNNSDTLSKEVLRGLVSTNPLALLLLRNKEDIDYVNDLLPYSIGFEIECGNIERADFSEFHKIPFIIDVDCDEYEKRFRIPSGINGILCLYFISLNAKIYLTLNMGSGMHYHCDFSDISNNILFSKIIVIPELQEYVLKELESWDYKGTYNTKKFGGWFRCNSLDTIEYRVGEMTFDYNIWIKRILHVTQLSQYIRDTLNIQKEKIYEEFKPKDFIHYQASLATSSGIVKKEKQKQINPKQIVNSRITKL